MKQIALCLALCACLKLLLFVLTKQTQSAIRFSQNSNDSILSGEAEHLQNCSGQINAFVSLEKKNGAFNYGHIRLDFFFNTALGGCSSENFSHQNKKNPKKTKHV